MNIDDLKGKTLDDETFGKLKAFADDLIGQRDAARNESINGRKGKDKTINELKARVEAFAERLGVEVDADLDSLPEIKGQAEAVKQYESKLKRLERDVTEANKARDEATGKFRQSQQKALVAEALGAHEFVARDIVETYVSQRLQWEGDDVLFKTDDGKLVPIKDGVAGVAKTRPELLKSQGAGGAGVRPSNAGGGGQKSMTRAEFEALPPQQRMEAAKTGVTLT